MAGKTTQQCLRNGHDANVQDRSEDALPLEEMLKRLTWAAVSVPAPDSGSEDLKHCLLGLSPEELLKVRSSAALLQSHHAKALEFLQMIMNTVHETGYISPIRVK